MSKYVKDLVTDDLRGRLNGVSDALLVNISGLDGVRSNQLRLELRRKNIHMVMVKNSLARRATEGTTLAAAFEQAEGPLAMVWGTDDIVSLAKAVTIYAEDAKWAPLQTRGGVMDGQRLSAEQVREVSKWPSREEQLSILVGQILSPGANLAAQILGPGAALASQIKQKGEEKEGEAAPAAG